MADDDFSWDSDSDPQIFLTGNRHVKFLEMMSDRLINRLTLAYFAIVGLDILGALDMIDKLRVATWVLSLQAHPKNDDKLESGQLYGFHGSRSSQFQSDNEGALQVSIPNGSHLASTYCANSLLKSVGYDLLFVDPHSILRSMKTPSTAGWESYDRGVRVIPGSDLMCHRRSHLLCCCISALMRFIEANLLSKIMSPCIIDVPLLLDWTLQGGDDGFHLKLDKSTDTCYAFWVGGVLKISGAQKFIDDKGLRRFLLSCQSQYGGFSKFPGQLPDLYHSYHGFCAFSLLGERGLKPVNVELGVTDIAAIGLCL